MKNKKILQIIILVVLMSSVLLFVTFIGLSNRNIRQESNLVVSDLEAMDGELKDIELYKKETIDDFFINRIEQHRDYLLIIEKSWKAYTEITDKDKNLDNYIKDFISMHLNPIIDASAASIVLVYNEENEILYINQSDEDAYDMINSLRVTDEIQILNGDPDAEYGTQDRFFFTSDLLKDNYNGEKIRIEVYLGFNEKEIFTYYLDYININRILEIKKNLKVTINDFNNKIISNLIILQYISLIFLVVFTITGIYIINDMFF